MQLELASSLGAGGETGPEEVFPLTTLKGAGGGAKRNGEPVAADARGGNGDEADSRRRSRRFPARVEVNYGSEHNFYTGFMENLSGGGLFVATHQPARLDEMVEVTFTVPGLEQACTAICRVRWLREHNPQAPDTVAGMGLEFHELDPEVRAAVELFIRHREPIFFDD
ncbi:MAG: TIGR02266 family protein [Deltaproteobacteria bacterium]|nr:TIGR02266 family protein [Deltaproteobacteria bacterium]